ncbi:hypothetical protein [Marinactinospora rubrisoli]|uniref:Uncharacterized protein n=1 Tax=Marinactinospora rubrisoli TaxID=2715399 RepID=A0ABW2KNL3_9ACTN
MAKLLVARRSELRPEWRDRTVFARDVGLSPRTLSDLEKARRENYRKGWLTQVEYAYRWTPGSVQAVLEGGDPTPAEEAALTGAGVVEQEDDEKYSFRAVSGVQTNPRGRRVILYEMRSGMRVHQEDFPADWPPNVVERAMRQAMEATAAILRNAK